MKYKKITTIDEILNLRPRFRLNDGSLPLIEWFTVSTFAGCYIKSGLRHADGITKSPFHYEHYEMGEDAIEKSIKKFSEWYNEVSYQLFKKELKR